MVIKSLLFLPDGERSFHLLLGTLGKQIPDLLNGVGLVLISIELSLLILFPGIEDSGLNSLAINSDGDIVILMS